MVLSTTTFVETFNRSLEHNQTEIPMFVAKIISHLALLRRSNGDRFDCYGPFTSFSDFIEYCEKTEAFLISLDIINLFPTIGSRFKDNTIPHEKIKNFFRRIYLLESFPEVTQFLINELNWICRANPRNISFVKASKLYEWIFVVNQDSRPYGFRYYRSSVENLLIFKSEIIFNKIFAFLSIIFIEDVFVVMNGKHQLVREAGMFEDIIDFDTSSSTIYQTYLSSIFSFFNSSSSSDNSSSTTNKKPIIDKKNKLDNVNNKFLKKVGENGFPSGSRSYSSSPIGVIKSENLYVLQLPVKNRKRVKVYFDSLSSLNDFILNLKL